MTLVITGSTGFIGKHFVQKLLSETDETLILWVRQLPLNPISHPKVQYEEVGDLAYFDKAETLFHNCSAVIHLAGRVHRLKEKKAESLAAFRAVNVVGTLKLATLAAKARVKRFIYMSSIGVNGLKTEEGCAFREEDAPNPLDPYATSKYEAECALWALSASTGMELVVIRPPMVYGPGAPGNYDRLLYWVRSGVPLPLGNIDNVRSMVSVLSLVDFLIGSITHPNAANQLFLVSDKTPVSTSRFIQMCAKAEGVEARLFSCFPKLMPRCLKALGRPDLARRLYGSLVIDASKASQLLNWQPKG